MKFILLPFLILISSCLAAQPNSDAAKMKKEGTKQIFFYTIDKSPVPNVILYYNENGFLYRELSLDWYPSDDPHYAYTLTDYDRSGRLVKSESGTYYGTSAENIRLLKENKMSTSWNYVNDSLLIQTDSVFYGNRIGNVTRKITVTHWRKNLIPPKNRPIFLTDSFPEKEKITETVYHYYYQSKEINGEDEPVKIDSAFSVMKVSYGIDSIHMTGEYAWESHDYDTIQQYTTRRIYTLYRHSDTLTYINYSWINLPTPEEKFLGLDNLYYITTQLYVTKKRMRHYVVTVYPALYKGAHAAEGFSKPRRIKTKDPWHNYQLDVFYPEEFIPEDYSLSFFVNRYSPKKIVRVK